VGDYLNHFVLGEKISPLDRLFGAWAGLGVGWALVLAAIFGSTGKSTLGSRRTVHALLFAAGVAVTILVGSYTALDLGRSTILILPVVPMGWMLAARTTWWSRFFLAPGLAAIALLVPARHVVGKSSLPVDNIWTPSLPLVGAQNNLGIMYAKGNGVPRDSAAAAKWYRRAAEQGYAVAQNNLGLMYATGEGVPKDVAQAIAWYRRAAEQGNAVAQASLAIAYDRGDGVPKDSVTAAQWYRQAAEQGYAAAQSNLGVMYASGEGVPKDSAEAVKWYRRAAEQGNAVAQVNLGFMYANGEGVPRDYLQAARWYRLAARQGSATAQNNLGLLYANGDGVPKDLVQAHLWFSLAGSNAEENARANRAILEGNMTADQIEASNLRLRELIEAQPTR
jgi:TPR repeat protein